MAFCRLRRRACYARRCDRGNTRHHVRHFCHRARTGHRPSRHRTGIVKILLVTDSYPPEIRSASHLMLELAQELNHRGHRVTVITTWPEYNLDQEQVQKTFNELEV